MNQNNFGKYLRSLRRAKKMTISEVDKLTGMSHSYLSQIERGERNASPAILRQLSIALGVTYIGLLIKAGYVKEEEVLECRRAAGIFD